MPVLTWDQIGDRRYESGLDRGVLYLPDGSAIPWNGLTSVVEGFEASTTPVYYDGVKVNELITLSDFTATLKAVTYPDEFIELEGSGSIRRGVLATNQRPIPFGLCYRTRVGNDIDGPDASYKIHILYNLLAFPSDKTYASVSDDPSLVEFEWELKAIPEDVPGMRPTSHIILDSANFDPWLLEELEDILYGNKLGIATLIPMSELVTKVKEWYRVKIVDHGDGTWSAIAQRPGFIKFKDQAKELFEIVEINATYLTDTMFQISDTVDVIDVPQLNIADNGDGTWSATTPHDNIIVMIDETTFELRDVSVLFEGPDIFRISSTQPGT